MMSEVNPGPQAAPVAAPPLTFGQEARGTTRFADALRRHWKLIVLIVTLAVGSAILYSSTADDRFESEADLLVTPVSNGDTTLTNLTIFRESIDETRALITAARLTASSQVAARVAERLGRDGEGEALLAQVEVQPVGQSNIVSIKATDNQAEGAQRIANAFAEETVELRSEQFQQDVRDAIQRFQARVAALTPEQRGTPAGITLQQTFGELRALIDAPDPTLRIFNEAQVPTEPVWPRPVLSVLVALIAGLLLGCGLALGLEVFNPLLSREEELLLGHRLPILGRIPRMRNYIVRGYLSGKNPLPPDVREAYRTLRANVAAAGSNEGFPRTILITSAMPGEGKTLTSVNLAMTFAAGGLRVILADADLRRPMVATVLGLPPTQNGIVRVMLDRTSAESALVPAPGFGDRLRVLPATSDSAYLVDLLDPSRVRHLLSELVKHADVVVIDSAPITEVADALTIADEVDVILVAVRLGRTRRDRLTELRRILGQRGIAPTGLIVTTAKQPRRRGYYLYGSDDRTANDLPQPSSQPAVARSRRAASRSRRPST
jgi:receptor protein-tyrosine kinase